MKLKLTRPLVFFDLETTGLNIATDRIVEISYYKVFPNGSSEGKTFRVNPEIPIPELVSNLTGICDDDVKDCPTFKQIASQLVKAFEGCDLAGYNSNSFDVPLLAEELLRADVDFDLKKRNLVDAYVIFQKKEPRTLSAAHRFYCGTEFENAHSANADTEATKNVFFAQMNRYADLPQTIEELADYTAQNKTADYMGRIVYDQSGIEIFNFGKYKGQRLMDVFKKDTGYYGWLMNGDFPQYTKNVITRCYMQSRNK